MSINRTVTIRAVLFCIGILTCLNGVVHAQLEVNLVGGGNLSDRFEVAGGNARIFGGGLFGATLWYQLNPGLALEVDYMHQRADAEIISSELVDQDVRVGMNYIIAGAQWLFDLDNVEALDFNLGAKGGVTGIIPENDRYNNIWRFTLAANAGMRYNITDKFGLRFQLHILMPIQFGSGAFWVGNGGTGAGVTKFTTITQLGGVLGAYYRLTD